MAAELIVYGTSWCSDCKRAKRFLGEQQVKYRFVDVEADTAGRALVESHNDGKTIIPTIVFADGSVLVEPSNADLARKLGLPTEAKHRFYDVVVIGGGPAGLTAAFYAAREGLSVLVLERSSLGGQAALTERLDNYPGFPDGLSGSDFGKRLTEQSRRFGVEMVSAAEVSTIVAEEQGHLDHLVRTTDGSEYRAHAVLAAPGTTYRRLGAKGEADLIGAGIHYCATCDGPFYKGKELVVIGGGNSAAEEGQFLTQFASKVTLLVRGDRLSASKIYHDKVMNHPKMAVRFNTGVKEFIGTSRLEGLVIESGGQGGNASARGGLRVHRTSAEYEVPRWSGRPDERGLHRCAGPSHEREGCVRGGRRACGKHQAGRLSGRRGCGGGVADPPLPRGDRRGPPHPDGAHGGFLTATPSV